MINKLVLLLIAVAVITGLLLTGCPSPTTNGTTGDGGPKSVTLAGNIILPSQVDAGKYYCVVVDDDQDITNGFIGIFVLTTSGDTEVPYEEAYNVGSVPTNADYYVYAFVDLDDSGGGPNNDDYFGYYGETVLGDPVSQTDYPATANVSVQEADRDDLDIEMGVWAWHNDEYATVTGTITLPDFPVDGAPWGVFLDLDSEDDNGFVNWSEGECSSALSTYDYSFEAPPGTYYLYAFVDNDDDDSLSDNDFAGYYGGSPPLLPPSSAAVVVPATGTVDFDFLLGTWPLQLQLTIDTDGNGTTSPSGTVAVDYGVGTSISATPTNPSSYAFDYWDVVSGSATFGNANAASTTVTLTAGDAHIRAHFIQVHALTVNNDGNGSTTPSGTTYVKHGVATAIMANPTTAGYAFDYWEVVSGSPTLGNASAASTTVTLTGDATIEAHFTAVQYDLTVDDDGNGTTSPSGTVAVDYGVATSISATPTDPLSYAFDHWEVFSGSATFGNANAASTTVTLTAGDAHIRAHFIQVHALTVNNDGNGSTTPSGTTYVKHGVATAIMANPATGYAFDHWEAVSGSPTIGNANAASTTVTLTGDATIEAHFNETAASISGTITKSGSGSISPTSALLVWWYNEQTFEEGGDVYTSGTFPFDYTISGLKDGPYEVGAVLDKDNNGDISAGDLYGEYPSVVTISGSSQTGVDFEMAELGSDDGTITVSVYNAAAVNGHNAYFVVVARGDDPEADPYLGQGVFPITAGSGSGVAMDVDTGMTEVNFPGGILYDVYIFIDTDDSGDWIPETGEPMSDWLDVYVDGDTDISFDYSFDFYEY